MNWDGYTVFSVLSGAVLLIGVLAARGLSAKDRLWGFIGGAFFIGYGLYVAGQTSGTFFFPVWIFIIPPAAVIYLVAATVRSRPASRQPGAAAGSPGAVSAQAGSARPGLVQPGQAQAGVGPAGSGPAGSVQAGSGPAGSGPAGFGSAAPAHVERPAAWAPPPPPPGQRDGGVASHAPAGDQGSQRLPGGSE